MATRDRQGFLMATRDRQGFLMATRDRQGFPNNGDSRCSSQNTALTHTHKTFVVFNGGMKMVKKSHE